MPWSFLAQLSLMLGEAVANAVRHGNASNISVSICKTSAEMVVHIRDDGRGFGAKVISYKDAQLNEYSPSPLSLRERVDELGGSIVITSSSAGVDLKIELPLT